jgi:transmembrane sensor
MKQSGLLKSDAELLIVRYLTGSIRETELEQLNEWISAGSDNLNFFNSIKDAWILSGVIDKKSFKNAEESWTTLKDKISSDKTNVDFGLIFGSWSREKFSFKNCLKLAASWLLIFGLGAALSWILKGKPKETIAAVNKSAIEITTPLGSRTMVRMADSSKIWLNAGTTITYGQDYGLQTRTINLVGEAYFEVARDTLHTFIVNTEGIAVRALGTRFNVKAYREEKTISATLEEGKIDIRVLNLADKNQRVLLKPKEKLIYHKETMSTESYIESPEDIVKPEAKRPCNLKNINLLSDVRTELYTSWKDSRWIIYREPLSTLAPMLERRFNLKIVFEDEHIKKYKFTGIIENETVDQMLNALKMTAPIDYLINKDTIRLTMDINSKEAFKRSMTRNN